jgi:DNA-binding NtrC family response regulator
LRERGNDILVLAENFLTQYNSNMGKHIRGLSQPAKNKLLGHNWPGNVRELRNVIERGVILEAGTEIQPGSLPDFHFEGRLRKSETPIIAGNRSLDEIMADFERQLINSTLEQCRYNISKTADQLKISRHALRYRMQRLNIATGTDEEDTTHLGPKEG